jgi:hypothetical protein
MAQLHVGEGVTDITAPEGLELSGFHRPPGKERRVSGIRDKCFARCLAIRVGDQAAFIVSLDLCAISREWADRIRIDAGQALGVPATAIQIGVTHSHSTPAGTFFRQWGAMSTHYMAWIAKASIEAMKKAKADLAEAECYHGHATVIGGSFNRTSKSWKTEDAFQQDASDDDRWLDRKLQVLHFMRARPKRDLCWYHFSAHPVCYTDTLAGPDWVGHINALAAEDHGLNVAFLQGHCGDVNPGNGDPWIGRPDQVTDAIYPGFTHALHHAQRVKVDRLSILDGPVDLPFNIPLLDDEQRRYAADPEKTVWVDPGFTRDWAQAMKAWPKHKDTYRMPMVAMQLGPFGILFHGSELFSYYGLRIQHDAGFDHTLAVGYTNDFVGYLTDPASHKDKAYAADVVPKILGFPSFTPDAARHMTAAATALLKKAAV